MRYCKKCGAELPDGVSFCEKCGNPVGQVPKQGKSKKKWVIAISSGVIILAVAMVGVLFANGVIGGKDEAVQADADSVVQETPNVSGGPITDTEEIELDKQKDISDDGNTENMAWEAHVAYKAYMDAVIETKKEEYASDNDYDDYYDKADFLQAYGYDYCYVYLDSDGFPELVTNWRGARSGVGVYTYKNGKVSNINIDPATSIDYQERKGIVYHLIYEGGSYFETMYRLEGSYVDALYSQDEMLEEYDIPMKGKEEIAKEVGLTENDWLSVGDGKVVYCETVDEAYSQLLSRNKSN